MAGEQNLRKLLESMSPELSDEDYVFCTFDKANYGDHAELQPLASITENEGLSLIVPKRRADEHGVAYDSVFKRITLAVHSSLDAVGLTAAVASKLAEHGLSANVVAAYYHDHLFVQKESAEKAMQALQSI